MLTVCSNCEIAINENNRKEGKYILCSHCKRFMPIGACYKQINKKEVNMIEKKKAIAKEKTKTPKIAKPKKFDDTIRNKVFSLAKSGKSAKEIAKELGNHPNPKAIARWCKKENIELK